MSDAKLRRLREWCDAKRWSPERDREEAHHLDPYALTVLEIDRLLAEEQSAGGSWREWAEWAYQVERRSATVAAAPPPRRETLEQEIARLYGHEGR